MSEPADVSFSDPQRRALSAVLDRIIPRSADGRLPGAGELGLADHVEGALRQTPVLRPVVVQGLAAADEAARGRKTGDFAALGVREQVEVLKEIETAQPAFLPSLMLAASTGYYQNARVVEALGLEPRPPFPRGYEMEPDDPGLLDPVRQRPKLFRPC